MTIVVHVVDIHCHFLPGLDDGPRDPDEALAMLRIAAEAGTTDIVATPHASPDFAFDPAAIEAKIAELRAICGDLPRIHRGCDFHLTPENIADAAASPAKYSIDGLGYLLVEFSDAFIPSTAKAIFERLSGAGLIPVITHPERNPLLRRHMDTLKEWVEGGCLMQLTALSLFGGFGHSARDACREMIKLGLAHFVASDAHDSRHRTPDLRETRKYLESEYGSRHADILLDENPRAALSGSATVALPPQRRRWRFF